MLAAGGNAIQTIGVGGRTCEVRIRTIDCQNGRKVCARVICSESLKEIMAILVTGGAGYIGSVTVERLATNGESIVVLDDLSYGHREAIDAGIPFYQGSAGDRNLLAQVVKEHGIDSCMHFAASAFVAESVEKPALYFENNVQQGISLLNALVDAGVRRFIFSSSCTVYGEVTRIPIGEDSPLWPKNPYGWTKFTLERILETYDTAYGLKSVCLRYFNAAGATERIGEDHDPETHLIPNVLLAAADPHREVRKTNEVIAFWISWLVT